MFKSDERKVYLFHDGANIHISDNVKKLMAGIAKIMTKSSYYV